MIVGSRRGTSGGGIELIDYLCPIMDKGGRCPINSLLNTTPQGIEDVALEGVMIELVLHHGRLGIEAFASTLKHTATRVSDMLKPSILRGISLAKGIYSILSA